MLSVGASTPSVLAALAVAGVGGNVFQTINKAAVSQHAPPELVGTIMGMSGTASHVCVCRLHRALSIFFVSTMVAEIQGLFQHFEKGRVCISKRSNVVNISSSRVCVGSACSTTRGGVFWRELCHCASLRAVWTQRGT